MAGKSSVWRAPSSRSRSSSVRDDDGECTPGNGAIPDESDSATRGLARHSARAGVSVELDEAVRLGAGELHWCGSLARISQCAVRRRHSPAGANPARQLSLQPVADGADDGGNDIARSTPTAKGCVGGSATMRAATRVNAEQASKRVTWRPTCLRYREGCQRPGSERHMHRPAPPG